MRRRRPAYLDELRYDARHAIRQLRRSPAFTLIAVLTLALGVGATTAIFSAVYAVVLRPLPYHEPERLVRLYSTTPGTTDIEEVSSGNFVAWRRGSRSIERMAPIETRSFTFVEGTRLPEQVRGIRTSADYFPMLGVRPLLGRTFLSEEDRPGRDRVVVLSHRFWMSRFGGDRAVVGRVVRLNAIPVTIVGVMPPSFDVSAGATDLWAPIAFTPEQETSLRIGYLDVIARLRPGVTLDVAQAELSALAKRLEVERRENEGRGIRVVPYMADLVGAYRGRLFVLLGAVGLVLLIACVNVGNLLLARGVGRAKEMAVRAALGAGRGRVIRQLLAESAVLGLAGGAAGLGLAYWALEALKAASPAGVPRLEQASIDATALLFTLAVAVASSVFFGLAPALRSASPALHATIKEGGRASAGVTRDRVRDALVMLEVALSLVLLVGAGLLIRSAILVQRVDPGLDPSRLWTGAVTLPPADYGAPEYVTRTFERIVDEIRTVPGVQEAAAISVVPFSGLRALGGFVPEGRAIEDPKNVLIANIRIASPQTFATLRIPVREGRAFSDRDNASAPEVVVVNEAFARMAWPGERALGKRLYGPGSSRGPDGRRPPPREVVGVVGATHEDGLREERRPAVYYPLGQVPPVTWEAVSRSMFLVARTATEQPLSITNGVQAAVLRIDPTLPVFGVRSMEQRMAESLATARFNTRLLTVLGVVGLILAAVGIYGVIGYFVSQRTQEIGVRMALGATPRNVVTLVVGQGMRPVIAGVAVGTAAALAVTRVLAGQLYGVGATDPVTFVAVVVVLVAVAILAAAVPARRAVRVDPRTALGM